MIYAIEDNHLTEQKTIFDKRGLQYHLEITNSFDEDGSQFSAIFNLVRDYRNCNVGRANCLLFSDSDDALLGDIQIFDNVEFYSINDKLYRLFNWNEPINYQKRGLGTILLTYVIKLAKYRKAKKLHGSLTEQDLSKNPNLIKWYKKHGFKIEKPTADEVNSAVYRACLYLEQLLEIASTGEEIIITKNNQPMVKFVSIQPSNKRPSLFGSDKDMISITDDFDEPLEDFIEQSAEQDQQLTPQERTQNWLAVVETLPKQSANLPDEALHRDTMYEDEY